MKQEIDITIETTTTNRIIINGENDIENIQEILENILEKLLQQLHTINQAK